MNYSYETSLPAYQDNIPDKEIQMMRIVKICRTKRSATIKEIARILHLPDSTISGRVNDAIDDGLLKYDGTVVFMGRKRKRIVPVKIDGVQKNLFE